MPKVWNKRDPNCPKDAVYVGRPTKWGNEYSHLPSKVPGVIQVATRDEAVARYRAAVEQDIAFMTDIRHELMGKDLVCWCAPKPCHADVLLEIANATEAEWLQRVCA